MKRGMKTRKTRLCWLGTGRTGTALAERAGVVVGFCWISCLGHGVGLGLEDGIGCVFFPFPSRRAAAGGS